MTKKETEIYRMGLTHGASVVAGLLYFFQTASFDEIMNLLEVTNSKTTKNFKNEKKGEGK